MKNKNLALIAVRKGSQRIKNKNIKNFCGSSLLEIKVKQAMRCNLIDEVVVSSDCNEMLDLAKKLGATVKIRPDYYCSHSVPMNEVYEHLAKSVNCENIVYLHVTSPLLKDETLNASIENYYKSKKKGYDSLASVELIKKYLWYENKPINYNPSQHPRSQDLPRYYGLNFAVNIISREKMITKKNIIGENFFPFFLDEIESIDVDNKIDFITAENFYKSEYLK